MSGLLLYPTFAGQAEGGNGAGGEFGKLLLSRAPEALSFPRRVTQPETDGPSGGMENQDAVGEGSSMSTRRWTGAVDTDCLMSGGIWM